MANTQTIKQRFLDILFEDEDDDDLVVEKPKPRAKDPNRVKASDLLYGKKKEEKREEPIVETKKTVEEKPVVVSSNKQSNTFINYEKTSEKVKVKKEEPVYDEVYVAQPALSPIFGNIEKDLKPKKEDKPISVDYASTEKPKSNYLGTVLSPIYGYDSITANDARSSLIQKEEKEKKEEIIDEDITGDLGDIFKTDEFKQESLNDTQEIDLFSDFYSSKDE